MGDVAGLVAGAGRLAEADGVGVEGAVAVPGVQAAERVDLADRRAADRIVAARQGVDQEAGAAVRAAGDLVAEAEGVLDAGGIPADFAAEGVERRADLDAAARVFAAGEIGRGDEAGTGGGRTAVPDRVGAKRLGEEDANGVPDRYAADRVGPADRLAAGCVSARRRAVDLKAGPGVDITAVGADLRSEVGALLVPLEEAAVGIDVADRFAAAGVVAAGVVVADEAGSLADITAVGVRRAEGVRGVLARLVPAHHAAEVVEEADLCAAGEVVAAGVGVDALAASGGRIAAEAVGQGADRARELDAVDVPAGVAAEVVDVADRFAAIDVIAIGRLVGDAAVAGGGIAAARAEEGRPLDADLVPGRRAADRIDGADLLAADRIGAAGALVDLVAVAGAALTAADADLRGLLRAVSIPLDGAAVVEAREAAHVVAAIALVAAFGEVRVGEAGVLGDAAGAAELHRDGDAELVPRGVAAGRLDGADGRAADLVIAARRIQVHLKAALGGDGAGRRRIAGHRWLQGRREGSEDGEGGGENSHGGDCEGGAESVGTRRRVDPR